MKTESYKESIAREQRTAKRRATYTNRPTEDNAQIEFVEWARKHAELVWHTPNARKYSRGSWNYWKRMGVLSGIPDVMLICHHVHIALEFKKPGEKGTPEQKTVLGILHRQGWSVAIVHSAEQAKAFVREVAPVWDTPENV